MYPSKEVLDEYMFGSTYVPLENSLDMLKHCGEDDDRVNIIVDRGNNNELLETPSHVKAKRK